MASQRGNGVLVVVALVLALVALVLLWPLVAGAAPLVQAPVAQPVTEPVTGRLSAEAIVTLLAGGLAIVLEVIPGLQKRWDCLTWETKRFLWLAGCVVLGLAPPVLACLGRVFGVVLPAVSFVTTCDADGLARGGQMAFTAFFASQTTHGLSKVGVKAFNYLRKNV